MRKHKLSLILSLLMIPAIAGCSLINGGKNNGGKDGGSGDGGNTPIPSSIYKIDDPNYSFVQRNSKDEVTFNDLFSLYNKVEITIDVDKS